MQAGNADTVSYSRASFLPIFPVSIFFANPQARTPGTLLAVEAFPVLIQLHWLYWVWTSYLLVGLFFSAQRTLRYFIPIPFDKLVRSSVIILRNSPWLSSHSELHFVRLKRKNIFINVIKRFPSCFLRARSLFLSLFCINIICKLDSYTCEYTRASSSLQDSLASLYIGF